MIHYLPNIGAAIVITAIIASVIVTEFAEHSPFSERRLLAAAVVVSALAAIAILAIWRTVNRLFLR